MCKTYFWMGDAVTDINKLKQQYQYCQRLQEQLKIKHNNWHPKTYMTEEEWHMQVQEEMWFNRQDLKRLAQEIKDIRKEMKRLDREQNIKNKNNEKR